MLITIMLLYKINIPQRMDLVELTAIGAERFSNGDHKPAGVQCY